MRVHHFLYLSIKGWCRRQSKRNRGFGLESSDSWLGGREVEDWRSSNPTPAQGRRAFHMVLGMLKHAVLWLRPEHPHRDIAACRLRANL